MPVDSALIAALLAPVTAEAPAGKDLRYDARYDQVKEARREDLELPPGGLATERKLADWPAVVRLASALLEKQTKDLQLGAWLTEALLKKDGLAGLATGLDVLHGILDRYWEGCFPAWDEDDPELRAGPLELVGGKFDVLVRQTPIAPGVSLLAHQLSRAVPTEEEGKSNKEKRTARDEALAEGKMAPEEADKAVAGAPKAYYKALVADTDAAIASLAGLERVADEKFGRDAPSFLKLRGALDEMRRVAGAILAQKLIEDPDPIIEVAEEEFGAFPPPEGWNADGGGLPPEPVNAADAAARVGVAARFLRKQAPSNPAPYLMLRGFRWGELRAAPNGSGVAIDPKLLEAPPTATRTKLKGLLLDGNWPELLEQCEAVMATPQGRGWLDLQRYALTACTRLGAGYDAVAQAVRTELRTLLATLPQLAETTLMDDTPTANRETQAWLAAEGLLDGAAPAAPAAADGADARLDDRTAALDAALAEDDATSEHGGLKAGARRRGGNTPAAATAPDPFAYARSELAQGRPNRAIELLLGELARERSPRGRFVRQTQIAYVMVEAGHHAVARPILEQLVSTIDSRSLEEWEAGPLVAQPMALLCRVIDKLEEGYSSTRAELYLRICRLDPLQAIPLQL
jgi:type VI secretion system protein ImpA